MRFIRIFPILLPIAVFPCIIVPQFIYRFPRKNSGEQFLSYIVRSYCKIKILTLEKNLNFRLRKKEKIRIYLNLGVPIKNWSSNTSSDKTTSVSPALALVNTLLACN